MELFNDFGRKKSGKAKMKSLEKYLKNTITDNMPLENIIDVFEQMCQFPIDYDMILFETGTYDFTGEPLFQISLVRQIPNDDDDEFYQLHVDVFYKPTDENKVFSEATWNEDISENIFDYIRKSQVFSYAKNIEYIKTEISLDET